MSASCAVSGFGFTAQSPYTRTRSERHMKKTLETTETPSRARMISKAGRIVSPSCESPRTPSRRRRRRERPSCRSSSGLPACRKRAPRSLPGVSAARSSERHTLRGVASRAGFTICAPSTSTPIAAARALTSSGFPRIVSSTTPRRSRISAAHSTRSSSPSGRTMCFWCALARSINSYSNMSGVTRAGGSRAIRRSTSAVSTAASKTPSAVAIFRWFSGRMNGCTACAAAAATCVG